jgi:hypothetical protein
MEVTIKVEFDSEDEHDTLVELAIPMALDRFNDENDMVALSWEGDALIEREEFDSAGYR